MQSPSSSRLRTAILLVATAIPIVSFAASETFLNGQSIYGQPGAVSGASRVVDVPELAPADLRFWMTSGRIRNRARRCAVEVADSREFHASASRHDACSKQPHRGVARCGPMCATPPFS